MEMEARFDGSTESVGAVRHWLRSVLGVSSDGAAELVVSELATNAVQNAQGKYVVRVDARGGTVRIEVTNSGSASIPWCDVMPEPEEENGRGLPLVDAFASSWWVTRDAGLCTVGAELDLDSI